MLHAAERRQDSDVCDQDRADAEPYRAAYLRDAPVDPGLPACDASDGGGCRRLPTDVPRAARAEESDTLDTVLCPERSELGDLGVGQHHHAGSLGDTPDRDAARFRLGEDRAEGGRALDRRDLDPVAQAVGEARVAHGD